VDTGVVGVDAGVVGVDAGVVGVDAGVDGMDAGVDGPAAGAPGVADEFPGDVVAPPLPCPTACPVPLLPPPLVPLLWLEPPAFEPLAGVDGVVAGFAPAAAAAPRLNCRPTPGLPNCSRTAASATHIRGDSTGASGLDPTSLCSVAPASGCAVADTITGVSAAAATMATVGATDVAPFAATFDAGWAEARAGETPNGEGSRSPMLLCCNAETFGAAGTDTAKSLAPGPTADRWPTAFVDRGRATAEPPAAALGAPVRGSRDGPVMLSSGATGSAEATPNPMPPASPIPKAIAKAPTRPTYVDSRIWVTPNLGASPSRSGQKRTFAVSKSGQSRDSKPPERAKPRTRGHPKSHWRE